MRPRRKKLKAETDSISEYKLEFHRKSIQTFPVLSPEILIRMKLHSVVFSLALPHFFIKREISFLQ